MGGCGWVGVYVSGCGVWGRCYLPAWILWEIWVVSLWNASCTDVLLVRGPQIPLIEAIFILHLSRLDRFDGLVTGNEV